ncbi:MAG: 5-deoxy-glucuronate isomerase [Acidobacteriaceae bacterium]
MKLIKADHERRLEIPGVPGLARRPVDIDQSKTGFANLRSLRIYRFDAESVIRGHAEEDEVFVVVMAGSVELKVSRGDAGNTASVFTLSAADDSQNEACAAYLPPHAAYELVPRTDADIAYARATPMSSRPPTVFGTHVRMDGAGVSVLLEETTYADRLRLRLVQIDAQQDDVVFPPIDKSEGMCEALIHVGSASPVRVDEISGPGGGTVSLDSWDTVTVAPGECPTLRIAKGTSAMVLVVLAA